MSPAVSRTTLPGYPMLALSAARLLGPPPATVLMAYWASRSWGANKMSARATQTRVGNLGECMITLPPGQKYDPVGPLFCSLFFLEHCLGLPSAERVSAAVLFARVGILASPW